MYCQDYELQFSPSSTWFGGNAAAIVGECSCPYGYYFNDQGRNLGCAVEGGWSIGLWVLVIGLSIAGMMLGFFCICIFLPAACGMVRERVKRRRG